MKKVINSSQTQSRFLSKVVPAALAVGAVAAAVPLTASASDICIKDASGGYKYATTGASSLTSCPWADSTFANTNTNDYVRLGDSGNAAMQLSNSTAQFMLTSSDNTAAFLSMQNLGNGGVTIDGLAPGAVNASSLQAVNGSQLFGLSKSTAAALGGGSTVNSDGSITQPSYALTNANSINGTSGAATDVGTAFGTVDAALGKLNSNVTQNTADIANLNTGLTNGTLGLVQQDPTTRNITVAKATDGTVVDVTGTAGARTVTGVAAGAVSATSLDAINGSQLYATNQNVAQNTSNIAQNTSDIAALSTNVAQNTSDIASLNTNVAQNTSDIAKNTSDINNINTQLASGGLGLVKQDATTQNITVAKDTGGTVVDMTGTDGTRTVTGVSAGALSADSTDAVNGSQLYQTNQNVSSLAQQLSNVEGAASTVASQKTDTPAVASGTDSTALGNGSKATGNNSVALGSGSVADEDNTVSIGSKGNERRLTNVAPGINGTDGVNMNQLNAVQSNVDTVARQAFSGVAAAMAMPNLTPSQPGKTVVAAGVANYKGYTAMGVGGTYRSRDSRWLVNAAASITPHGDAGVRGQVGYEF
ncbi:YadA-like family protein [Caballeronia sp. TF1N1]|uniref:YadA family autotransporter adhesin n=1 Tax=Caballeronia sp. TF1N1 TaxID=2878153 RepID=UPI001FD3A3C5|nr:YadA-like family protein [Caballeronia sp. TF1N1]